MFDESYMLVGIAVDGYHTACFGVPIFRHGGLNFVQVVEDGKISHFQELCFDEEYCVVRVVTNLECVRGQDQIHAFYFNEADFVIGNRHNIINRLVVMADTLREKPFLLMDIYDFIGDKEKFLRSFRETQDVIFTINRRSGVRWRRALESSEYKFLAPSKRADHALNRGMAVFPSNEIPAGSLRISVIGVGGAGGVCGGAGGARGLRRGGGLGDVAAGRGCWGGDAVCGGGLGG